jgi:2-polyprenyl-3-methyl-5-hydroxy-6-metoxy-1,4-benzoquinol methylase
MVMKPDDLVDYSRQAYSSPKALKEWTRKEHLDRGLHQEEKDLLGKIPLRSGRLLLLGLGGGREAIPLAKMGFRVTGVDFVPSLVHQAKNYALREGVEIEGLVQDISKLDVSPNSYDLVWLCAATYSCVPTRKRRVEMLRRILKALKPGGYFICQYQYYSQLTFNPKVDCLRKIFAFLTLGNFQYEKGDMVWRESEFIHTFWSKESLLTEFEPSGFQIMEVTIPDKTLWGSAILRKPAPQSAEAVGFRG